MSPKRKSDGWRISRTPVLSNCGAPQRRAGLEKRLIKVYSASVGNHASRSCPGIALHRKRSDHLPSPRQYLPPKPKKLDRYSVGIIAMADDPEETERYARRLADEKRFLRLPYNNPEVICGQAPWRLKCLSGCRSSLHHRSFRRWRRSGCRCTTVAISNQPQLPYSRWSPPPAPTMQTAVQRTDRSYRYSPTWLMVSPVLSKPRP